MNRKIRVLVVEDSKFFQQLLVTGLNNDPSIEVVGVANDPFEARDAIIELRPDVMSLDVELPRMNGIEFLRRLMPQYPLPTIVVSALNGAVFDALAAGAVDFVNKPAAGSTAETVLGFISNELCSKLKVAASAKLGADHRFSTTQTPVPGTYIPRTSISPSKDMILAIGASTGGTEAIYSVVKDFDKNIPGTVVVQHMPAGFTAMYAERLNGSCAVEVKEAHDGDQVMQGRVLIANGSEQMRVVKRGNDYFVSCREEPKVSGHCPSVDVLFDSVAKEAGEHAIGVLLTGMGADGANGLLNMKLKGAETIGQNEASCVVYGMPKVAYDIGAVKYQLDLSLICGKIYQLLSAKQK